MQKKLKNIWFVSDGKIGGFILCDDPYEAFGIMIQQCDMAIPTIVYRTHSDNGLLLQTDDVVWREHNEGDPIRSELGEDDDEEQEFDPGTPA